MRTYAELILRGASLDQITTALRLILQRSDGWTTDEERNASYSELHGERCFWAMPPPGLIGTPIAIALSGSAKRPEMRMVNIVPGERSELSMIEYNEVAAAFARLLRSSLRRRVVQGVRVIFNDGTIGLDQVIPGAASRKFFKQFLAAHPLSYHPNDIQRLDFFIVALHRGGCCASPYRIEQYLIQDAGWSREDAAWLRDRVLVGLDVLRARRRFWRGR